MKKPARKRSSPASRAVGKPDTTEFDREHVADTFAEPSQADRARWKRVRRKRGRPRVGLGVTVISVSLERGLLRKCDRLARKKRISRASLVTRGLRAVLAIEGEAG